VTTAELSFIRSLAPMFETPRAAKRLTNLYRLIRVSVGKERIMDDGSYRPVLLLLAIAVAYPSLAGEMFRGILRAPGDMPWPEFVNDTDTFGKGPDASGQYRYRLGDRIYERSEGEAATWHRATSILDARGLEAGIERMKVGEFQDWVSVVAGFSFYPWREIAP
jgi:hypothetical protein